MSNLLKFILMVLSCGLLFLGSYYGCIKPEYCPDEPQIAVDPPPVAPVSDDYAVVSSYASNDVLTGLQWGPMLQGLYDRFTGDTLQALEVTGLYYAGETAPTGFDNMGLYRADQIKQLLVAKGIPADNIRTLSKLVNGDKPADEELFAAGTFGWGRMAASDDDDGGGAELVDVGDGTVKIRFPFDKSTRTLTKEIEDYLATLAERVKQTNETLTIVGHTDNVDTEEYNMRLGQRRADFVKQRLVSYGVDASLISTSSQGENNPEANNATAEGRRINRRAVVTLNKTQ